jgi:CubicO group peptidase (beta-lactamase class C family)
MLDGRPSPTVAHLASMSSGIPYDDPWADRQEAMTTADFDAMLRDGLRLFADPGTRYEYSSLGYSILGRVLERVSGLPYVRLVTERVIEPLGLPGIGYDRSLDVEAIAPGHARVAGRWEEQPWQEPGAFSPLGGIIATPAGLAAWAGWLAAAWRPDASDAVLSAASRRELQTAHTEVPGPTRSSYGFGLVVEHDERHGTVISHSGGYPGYGAHMRWHPDSGLGVVVLENARYSGATLPATKALTALLDGLAVPDAQPDLWEATRAARETVERLVRGWDDATAEALVADNVALDEPLTTRREKAERLRAAVGLAPDAPVVPLVEAAPRSDSAAHLAWSIRGTTGSLRCEIRMTPVREPLVETLDLRLG